MLILLLVLVIPRFIISSPAFPEWSAGYTLVLLIFLSAWLIQRLWPGYPSKTRFIALWLLFAAILTAFSFPDHLQSFLGLSQLLNSILLFLICQSLSYSDKNKTIQIIVVASAVISLSGFYQYFFGFQSILDYIASNQLIMPQIVDYVAQKRVYYPFINPNILGSFLIMIIPLALARKELRWLVIPLFADLVLTRSVGSLLCLSFMALLFYALSKDLHKRAAVLITGASLLTTIAIILVRNTTLITQYLPVVSLKTRIDYWQQTLDIIQKNPLIGIGLGRFDLPNSRYAHNIFLQLWAETGILGLALALVLLFLAAKTASAALRNTTDRGLTIALTCSSAGFLLANQFDFAFYLPEVSLLWFILLGLLLNTAQPAKPASPNIS